MIARVVCRVTYVYKQPHFQEGYIETIRVMEVSGNILQVAVYIEYKVCTKS